MSHKRGKAHPLTLPSRINFADTHFHALQMAEKGLDVPAELDRAIAEGMVLAVEVGVHPAELTKRLAILPEHEKILRSSGIGPSYSASYQENDLALLRKQIAEEQVSAVGEIGLDHHWDFAPSTVQIDLFTEQLFMASKEGLPVIVHNREADEETVAALRSVRPAAGGVLHCFSSNWETASRCLDLGFFISFAGNVTFRSSETLREVAKKVPKERLLIETDSPYLSPVPVRGSLNTPVHTPFIYELISRLLGISRETLCTQIRENAETLFGAIHPE